MTGVVYRVFDAAGRLIYIGSTQYIDERFRTHEAASWWYDLAHHVTCEPYPTIWAARAAEAVAIQEEQPSFNIQHTGRKGPLVTDADLATAVRWQREVINSRPLPWLANRMEAAA